MVTVTFSERYSRKLERYRGLNRPRVAERPTPRPRARRRRLAGCVLGRCHFKALDLRCPRFVPKRGRMYCDLHFKEARAAAISRGLKQHFAAQRLQLTAERDMIWSRSGSGDEWMGSILL